MEIVSAPAQGSLPLANLARPNVPFVLQFGQRTNRGAGVGSVILSIFIGILLALAIGHVGFVLEIHRARANRRRHDAKLFEDCVSRSMQRTRRLLAHIPGPPRCRICYLPFGGVGRLFPASPSRVNPNFCRVCFERLPEGAQAMDIGVLFADVRGFTRLAEQMPASEVTALSRRFFGVATDVLARHDAIIDSFMGDGIMALFLPAIPTLRDHTSDEMLAAAVEIISRLADPADGQPIAVGAAVHFGPAMVGNLGRGVVKEFCAVGDVVNTTARLQQRAAAGEVLVSDDAWDRLTRCDARGVHRTLSLRGKSARVGAHRIQAVDGLAPIEVQATT